MACITRLRLDAALYDPAPPRLPGRNGRPRMEGKRLATLSEVLTDPVTTWQRVTVPGWCGEAEGTVEVSANAAVWRHGGTPVVPVRRVPVRHSLGRFNSQSLLCTDQAYAPSRSCPGSSSADEVTFREVRYYFGVETQRQPGSPGRHRASLLELSGE